MNVGRRVAAVVVVASLFVVAAGCSSSKSASPTSASSSANDAAAYENAGPFPVGVTTLALPSGTNVEVWYPAAPETTGTVTYDVRDFVPASVKALLTADVPATFSYPGQRDAPAADGTFPLVVYSHGFAGMRVASSHLMSHLASWGMVAAAPDHPSRDLMHALVSQFGNPSDAVDDVAATIALLQGEASRAGSRLAGHVDASDVAVVGHSAGGATAEAAARTIAVVRGYVSLASGVFRNQSGASTASDANTTTTLASAPDKPTLFVAGADDGVASLDDVVKPAFAQARPPTRLWVIDRTGHNAFDDFCTFGNGTGIIGVAEASGLGPLLDGPQFSRFKTLGEDGCKSPAAPVTQTWPIIDHVVTAWLRNVLGIDREPVGLGADVAGRYPVAVTIDQRLS